MAPCDRLDSRIGAPHGIELARAVTESHGVGHVDSQRLVGEPEKHVQPLGLRHVDQRREERLRRRRVDRQDEVRTDDRQETASA